MPARKTEIKPRMMTIIIIMTMTMIVRVRARATMMTTTTKKMMMLMGDDADDDDILHPIPCMSLCLYLYFFALHNLMPSIIEA